MRARNYDSAEFTLATGQTDYKLRGNNADSFKEVDLYTRAIIRTDREISIRLNNSTAPSITITPKDAPFQIDWLEITNIYITNDSGITANIKMIGVE